MQILTCTFTFLHFTAYKWQPRLRLVKILTGQYWWTKTQELEICLSKHEAFCHFAFLTLRVFPLPPWKEIQLLTRFLCCLWCFVYLSFGWGKRRNFVFIGDNFFKTFYTGFHSRVTEKTKTFLTLVTYYLSGVASQVSLSYCIFFVSFIGGHNYLSYYLI